MMNVNANALEIENQITAPNLALEAYDLVIVDDDGFVLEIASRTLRHSSLQFRCFELAHEAIDFLRAHQTGLLIVDYRMPLINGMEFIEKVKDNPLISSTNVLITSTVSLPESVEQKAAEMGVQFQLKDIFADAECLEKLVSLPSRTP